MRNQYPGICYRCKEIVKKGKGHFQRNHELKRWDTIHAQCVFQQRKEKRLASEIKNYEHNKKNTLQDRNA